ncbi:ethanolamine kinase [Yamadazyma tenuis]|uniref:ethanolamine kinase n=1 Tax=Candida tenuis (strain ATCC 10573 / BCRC 21748 / CBS 615 / JCM 9827 / NBRC 10315 / NRRL Y-1498 / VKM Y-70) TaxID=590646 RepID=G3BBI9_CANTC|nr:uncharacterized protein CANTEDRAFT_131102 [Yamadazyma tenuis ATCC 10573]XP_006687720.1 kinase-like protein [Yamadazyma tenuis ATCC 10573]EGV61549.1 hypothetical protein CANTEDRAFT_131102 [Yamadazyma tenuis ATCC 10573]EGV61550.1 kinase-like protein [Yamadazyma tenuis ATCC 10573]WEJ92771.1 ethanolamine kinase [Yamadazyma tenuis]
MSTPSVYCFVSAGSVHCIPVNAFNGFSKHLDGSPQPTIQIDHHNSVVNTKQLTPVEENDIHLKIKHKNLLYNLNNPSLSDIESDSNDTNDESEYISGVIDNYLAHALYFPDYSIELTDNISDNYAQIREFLCKIFSKTWVHSEKITVQRLTGGITNMLLQCTYTPNNEIVLMRAYGPGTNFIIDRHREFISQLVLHSIHLAPTVHARFKNGLIYGFLEGRSLEPSELKHENLYPLIAQQLGNWHSKVEISKVHQGVEKLREYTRSSKRRSFDQPRPKDLHLRKEKERRIKKRYISNVWELIEDWINIVPIIPPLIESFRENSSSEVTEDNLRETIMTEFKWLKSTLESRSNSPVVSAHCDLLSGNIIIPNEELISTPLTELPPLSENPIQFIDYEYMLPAPRAFDIANHLAEWQGFNCDRSAIPEPSRSNKTLVRWVKAYLNDDDASPELVQGLIDEIYCYYGFPGFYWGIWAAIQSELSNIDFSYADYSKLRLQEYWDWKQSFLVN